MTTQWSLKLSLKLAQQQIQRLSKFLMPGPVSQSLKLPVVWCEGTLAHLDPGPPWHLCLQAPAATSELRQLPGEPWLRSDNAPCPNCRALHVRGAHSATLLEQPAKAGHALPAGGWPGEWAPAPNGDDPHTLPQLQLSSVPLCALHPSLAPCCSQGAV